MAIQLGKKLTEADFRLLRDLGVALIRHSPKSGRELREFARNNGIGLHENSFLAATMDSAQVDLGADLKLEIRARRV